MQYDNIKQTQSTYLFSAPFIPVDILIAITSISDNSYEETDMNNLKYPHL